MNRYFSKLAQKSGRQWLTGNGPVSSGRIETTQMAKPAEVSGEFSGRLREVHQETVIVEQRGQTVAGGPEEVHSVVHVDPGPMAAKADESVSPPGNRSASANDPAGSAETADGFAAPDATEDAVGNNAASAHVDRQARRTEKENTPAVEQVTVRETGSRVSVNQKVVVGDRSGQSGAAKGSRVEAAVTAGYDQDKAEAPLSAPVATAAATGQDKPDRQAGPLNQDMKDSAPDKPLEHRIRIDEQTSTVVEQQGDHITPRVFEPPVDNAASWSKKTGDRNPVSIRIGSIQLEVHQAAAPSPSVPPPPAPRPPAAKSQRPAATRLNRYYLRGW